MYCGDLPNAIFLKGDGVYANMDIDCDGANNAAGDCANDPTGQGQTAFQWIVEDYGIEDLDANLHSYVVFGNVEDSPSYEPDKSEGMEPLSVMAVVCNDQLVGLITKLSHLAIVANLDPLPSSMASGATSTAAHPPAKHHWLWLSSASLTRVSMVTRDTMRETFSTLASLDRPPSLVLTVPHGPLVAPRSSRRV